MFLVLLFILSPLVKVAKPVGPENEEILEGLLRQNFFRNLDFLIKYGWLSGTMYREGDRKHQKKKFERFKK